MNNVWTDILNSALIGTDKRPLNIDILPDVVKQEINKLDQKSEEEKLLSAAAMMHYYTQAGARPKLFKGDTNFQPINELHGVMDAFSKSIFARITETGYYEREYLLSLWLDKIITHHKIAPPDVIVPIIKLGITMTKSTRSKICTVIGERGKAIIPLIPEFIVPAKSPNMTKEWKEGSPEERRNFIIETRQSNQDEALQLIQSDWDVENIVFKRSLIEILSTNPTISELKFLQQLYSNEFAFKAKEKKTETECRYLLATALMSDSTSDLYRNTINHLRNYVREEKKSGIMGFLGTKESVFMLPNSPDGFLNGENMNVTFGIDPKNPDPALFTIDTKYWFSELLAIMPIESLNSLIEKSIEETFKYFTEQQEYIAKIEGKSVPIFLTSFEENVKNFKDQQLLILTLHKSQNGDKYKLLQYANEHVYESYIIQEKLFMDAQVIMYHPAQNANWSQQFSERMIDAVYETLVINRTHYYDKINQLLAKHLHPSLLPKLEVIFGRQADDYFKDYWIKHVHQPVKTCIEIKSSISQL